MEKTYAEKFAAEAENLGDTINTLVDDVENLKILVTAPPRWKKRMQHTRSDAFELYSRALVAISAELGAPMAPSKGLAEWAFECVEIFEKVSDAKDDE